MLAILAIVALACAPAGAKAHAGPHGHEHGPERADQHGHIHAAVIQSGLSAHSASASAPGMATAHRAQVASANLVIVAALGSCDDLQDCAKGCCHACGGTSCCPAWLSPAAALVFPRTVRPALDASAVRGAGIFPDALPEPPKVLV